MQDRIAVVHSACPHDCPSTCALDVELLGNGQIGRVHGSKDNRYTAGVICAKVARYAERIHHPDRLLYPLKRKGPKGSKAFERIGWDEAMRLTADAMNAAERQSGAESVWPYYFAGTMGHLMRDGINRLRHVKGYAGQHSTICTTLPAVGFRAATGAFVGPDPCEMAKSDCVVIWGTNPVNTQVNVMTHVTEARKKRGAKLVVVDIYRNGTAAQADMALILRPGTDAALACAVMHVLFRDDHANWDYLEQYTDCPRELEQHLQSRTPEWASAITGLSVAEIETFAKMVGTTPRSYFRLGYGFARSRNGAHNMHAALCIPSVTGAWLHEGGGGFHNNGAIYHWNKSLIEGLDVADPKVRVFDQCRIGPILTGDQDDLKGGPPVAALFIQNMNPVQVAPEQRKVKAGFMRDDLFVCTHEQFMTATAEMSDIVLPATMFLEHDDVYQGGGHSTIMLGPKLLAAPGECRSNHEVIRALAKRVQLLVRLARLVGEGGNAHAVVEAQGKAIFWKEKGGVERQLKRWSPGRLATLADRLLAAERAIKSPSSPGDILADVEMITIARAAARIRRRGTPRTQAAGAARQTCSRPVGTAISIASRQVTSSAH